MRGLRVPYAELKDMNFKVITKDGKSFIPKIITFDDASTMKHTVAYLIPADALLNGV
jgi:hypothetical protein